MAFPLGWPPRVATGVRSFRFYASGTSTANFYDSAYLFSDGNKAYTTIGGKDANGVVLVNVDATGAGGNDFSIEVIIPSGGPLALSAAYATGSTTHIEIKLAKSASGDLDTTANTATLVATAVNALASVSASAFGTGATSLSRVEPKKYFFGGGPIIAPTPKIDWGSRTPVRLGGLAGGGSPMGGGKNDGSPRDPYTPPPTMVWASTILISNDDSTATNTLEYSFDGINVHGLVRGGETLTLRNRYEAGIAVRRGANTPAFRIHAW